MNEDATKLHQINPWHGATLSSVERFPPSSYPVRKHHINFVWEETSRHVGGHRERYEAEKDKRTVAQLSKGQKRKARYKAYGDIMSVERDCQPP